MSDLGGVAPSDLAVDPNTGMAVAPNALLGAGSAWRAMLERSLADINRPMFPGGTLDLSHPMLGFAGPGSIKGFHGTPHLFEPVEGNPFGEFRNEAIGTGEGAQAFGYGHYVAGAPAVAKTYQEGPPFPTLEGQDFFRQHELAGDYVPWFGMKMVSEFGGDTEQAIAKMRTRANQYDGQGILAGEANDLHKSAQWLEDNKQNIGWNPGGGHLLEVHILPDEHELLDWDKPLAEQPEGVQAILNHAFGGIGDNMSGADIYRALTDNANLWPDSVKQMTGTNWQQRASAALHEAGIPGIRYLDAGSRVLQKPPMLTQQGWKIYGSDQTFPDKASALQAIDDRLTRNYVIFDPSNLRIIARNGQRLEPVEHDPFAPEAPKP